ncbi:MAG: ATPase, partial [Armatimonadia bacterium]|nr:ATPase [Armatimonadia bacterium]
MNTPDALRTELTEISGRGYPAYRSLLGTYDFGHFMLDLDHIQKDPFAAPTRARVRVPMKVAKFPSMFTESAVARRATADWIVRRAAEVIGETVQTTKRTGALNVDVGGQEVLWRTAALIDDETLELRLNLSLPGEGRTVLSEEAERLFFHSIPTLCREALMFHGKTSDQLRAQVEAVEDQVHLRGLLTDLNLVAFIADGSILPRRSGVSDLPMEADRAVPVEAPKELRVTVDLPHAGEVSGLGIPEGVTVITGGGFHGKSTLLRAIEAGVYDHIPGDGRELAVSDPSATRVRAEEGRYVTGLDLRTFFRPLPDDSDIADFSTDNASGSVSQAANLLEALEMGSKLLLLDEDNCAT